MTTDNELMQNYCRAISDSHAKDIQHLEQRMEDFKELVNTKFEATALAVETADVNSRARELTRRVTELEKRMAGYDGRLAGVALFILIITFVLKFVDLGV